MNRAAEADKWQARASAIRDAAAAMAARAKEDQPRPEFRGFK
jgi:hypothetical protein